MADSDKDHSRSMRLSVEDQRWSSTGQVLGGCVIGRSGDAMCGLYRAHEDDESGFLS
jgi:hypothetical protein